MSKNEETKFLGTLNPKQNITEQMIIEAQTSSETMNKYVHYVAEGMNLAIGSEYKNPNAFTVLPLPCLKYLQDCGVVKGLTTIDADIVGNARDIKEKELKLASKQAIRKETENKTFLGFQILSSLMKNQTRKLFSDRVSIYDPILFNAIPNFFTQKTDKEELPSLFADLEEASNKKEEKEYIDLYIETEEQNSFLYFICLNDKGNKEARLIEIQKQKGDLSYFITFGYLMNILVQSNKELLSSECIDCISTLYYEDYKPVQTERKTVTKNTKVPMFDDGLRRMGVPNILDLNKFKGQTVATFTKPSLLNPNRLSQQTFTVPSTVLDKDKTMDIPTFFGKYGKDVEKVYDFMLLKIAEKYSFKNEEEKIDGMQIDLHASEYAKLLYATDNPDTDQINRAYKTLQSGIMILSNMSQEEYYKRGESLKNIYFIRPIGTVFFTSDPEHKIFIEPSTIRVSFDPEQAKGILASRKKRTIYLPLLSIPGTGGSIAYNVGNTLANQYASFFGRNLNINEKIKITTLLDKTILPTEEEMKAVEYIRKKGRYAQYSTARLDAALQNLQEYGFLEYYYENKDGEIVPNTIMATKYKEAKELILCFKMREIDEDPKYKEKNQNWIINREEGRKKKEERKKEQEKSFALKQTLKTSIKESVKENLKESMVEVINEISKNNQK